MLLVAGACFFAQSGSFDKCSLGPSECTSGQVFRSPGWLATNNVDILNQCSEQDNIRKLRSLGRCDGTADRHICTSDKTACRFQAVYSPLAPDCNLVHDFSSSSEFNNAHYGFCISKQGVSNFVNGIGYEDHHVFCAWMFDECQSHKENTIWEQYKWHTADTFSADTVPECHCDDVRTGACIDTEKNEIISCAVTADVCEDDEGSTYLPVLDLEFQMNITCKLCETLSASELQSDGGGIGIEGSDDGRSVGNQNNSRESGSNGKRDAIETKSAGMIGIVVGSLIGIVATIIGIIFVAMHRQSSEEKSEVKYDPRGDMPSVI